MKKPKKGASRLEREVAAGYRAFLARRGLKPAGKWNRMRAFQKRDICIAKSPWNGSGKES